MTERSQRSLPVRVGILSARQPAGQPADGHLVLAVAAEHLAHDLGFVFDDLVAGLGDVAATDVAVAVGGAAENVDHTGPSPKSLAAPGPFDDQGPLVLGHHPLELQQHLVFGGLDLAGFDEADLAAGLVELVDQQRLVGELSGQAVG